MIQRLGVFATCTLLAAITGCGAIPTPEEVSREFLFPDVACQEAAEELQIPAPFEPTDPGDIGLAFEDFTVTSDNGASIAGWFVPAPANTNGAPGTVLLLHGNVGTRACALPWVSAITSNGCAAVTFDYQGFDGSGGAPNLATLLDDSSAVLDWIRARDDDPGPVHLLGVSLGTAPAAGLALRRPNDIASVALDSPFDPRARFDSTAMSYGVPPFLVELYARSAFEWLFETRDRLGEIETPVIFLVGELDTASPPENARDLFNAWGTEQKSFHTFDGLSHVQPVFFATEDYTALLTHFWRNARSIQSPKSEPRPHCVRRRPSREDEGGHSESEQSQASIPCPNPLCVASPRTTRT